MKAILGSLLCFVLFASECFALSGGPQYPGGTNVVGSYAGVLQPAFDPTDPFSSNSLGVFTLVVPSTGESTGNFMMFSRGRAFSGTIQGVTDPNTAKISALLDATFNYTITYVTTDDTGALTTVTVDVTATVNGPLTATIKPTRSLNAASSSKIRGTATAFISNGGVEINGDPTIDGTLSCDVIGFKQSDSAGITTGAITP
jgi:hypothetical protein